jgi:hypothetical protein
MSEERLRPARPQGDTRKAAYMPRLPWKWIIVGFSLLLFLGVGHWYRTTREADAIRAGILSDYEGQLSPLVRRYRGFRHKIEEWVMSSARAGAPRRYADPRLQIAALHRGTGVYLRLRAEDATDEESIERGARNMEADSIGRCLGIAPISLRGFYEGGRFLMPRWLEELRAEGSVARLKVVAEDYTRRRNREIPNLDNAMDAEYFLLAIERGPNRREHPVDVYMWDLRHDRALLSLRAESTGLLIPARIELPGVPRAPLVRPQAHAQLAADCSIAAQVKEVTGEPALTFGSELPTPGDGGEGETGTEEAPTPHDGSGEGDGLAEEEAGSVDGVDPPEAGSTDEPPDPTTP